MVDYPKTEAESEAATKFIRELLDGCENSNAGALAAAWRVLTILQPAEVLKLRLPSVAASKNKHIPTYGVINHFPHTDHTCDPWDITEAWIEESGDEDQTAKLYFDHNHDFGQYNPAIVGLEITEAGVPVCYGPEGAVRLLGIETASRLEAVYSERMNG